MRSHRQAVLACRDSTPLARAEPTTPLEFGASSGQKPRTGYSAVRSELPAFERGQRTRAPTINIRGFLESVADQPFERHTGTIKIIGRLEVPTTHDSVWFFWQTARRNPNERLPV
jgi:hypothetical protein